MYIFSYHSHSTLESPVLVQSHQDVSRRILQKKDTVMPTEQYSSVLIRAPPKLGQLGKTMRENRELQASEIQTLPSLQQSLVAMGGEKYMLNTYEIGG